jgi:hypothetical protein
LAENKVIKSIVNVLGCAVFTFERVVDFSNGHFTSPKVTVKFKTNLYKVSSNFKHVWVDSPDIFGKGKLAPQVRGDLEEIRFAVHEVVRVRDRHKKIASL